MATKGHAYDFPLRRDFLAQLVLPINLTEREAKRLAAFLMTLVDETGAEQEGQDREQTDGPEFYNQG